MFIWKFENAINNKQDLYFIIVWYAWNFRPYNGLMLITKTPMNRFDDVVAKRIWVLLCRGSFLLFASNIGLALLCHPTRCYPPIWLLTQNTMSLDHVWTTQHHPGQELSNRWDLQLTERQQCLAVPNTFTAANYCFLPLPSAVTAVCMQSDTDNCLWCGQGIILVAIPLQAACNLQSSNACSGVNVFQSGQLGLYVLL